MREYCAPSGSMGLLDRATSIRDGKGAPSTRASCGIEFNRFICILSRAFEEIETESDKIKLKVTMLLGG